MVPQADHCRGAARRSRPSPDDRGARQRARPITNLAALAELRELEELDIRYSTISSLAPLEQLTSLRRLALEACAVSETELDRFSRVRPDVEITYYKDWPGASIVLPMRDCKPLESVVRE
jgi:hypothetical protein